MHGVLCLQGPRVPHPGFSCLFCNLMGSRNFLPASHQISQTVILPRVHTLSMKRFCFPHFLFAKTLQIQFRW